MEGVVTIFAIDVGILKAASFFDDVVAIAAVDVEVVFLSGACVNVVSVTPDVLV